MRYLTEDPLPKGLYSSAEAAIIRYAQKSTRLEPIDDATYGNLARHFSKEHIIDIIMRDNPGKKGYYRMVWEDQSLNELVTYKLANVYADVPETGFLDEYDRPDDITAGEYFKILFKTLENFRAGGRTTCPRL